MIGRETDRETETKTLKVNNLLAVFGLLKIRENNKPVFGGDSSKPMLMLC